MAMECLTEIPDDAAALRAITAALVPGGLLIAQVPDVGWQPILSGSASTWRNEVRHGYGAAGWSRRSRPPGLAEIAIRPTFHAVAMVAQEIRDRIEDSSLAVRLLAFPFMLFAARLEDFSGRPHRRGQRADGRPRPPATERLDRLAAEPPRQGRGGGGERGEEAHPESSRLERT